MKGVITLRVAYDSKNDVISMYLEVGETNSAEMNSDRASVISEERNYDVEEAAGLILDMVDLKDEKGNFTGFRVFNASRYYDLELLKHADCEELDKKQLNRPSMEKVIAVYDRGRDKIRINRG